VLRSRLENPLVRTAPAAHHDRVGRRGWCAALVALAVFRVALPLAALVASGSSLPGFPYYDYVGLTGDATGFYAATREFLASWGRLRVPVLLALVVATAAAGAILVRGWWSGRTRRPWLVAGATAVFAVDVSVAVTQMRPAGAAAFGWPLIWSLPMLPYRALGGPIDPDIAFGFGVALSLAANAVTVVATGYAGLYATGRRAVGVAAAAAFSLWPLLVGLIGGERAWGNGTWAVDAGLAIYNEPTSTALVTVALALLLSPRLSELRLAVAGAALGLGTAVKLSNGLLGGVAFVLLADQLGARRTIPLLASSLPFGVLVATYWPKGYVRKGLLPEDPFALRYADDAWADSLLFGPRTLAVLVPLAVVGAFAIRSGWARRVLTGWVLVTAAFYTFYRVTPEHPRFLFAVLPAVLILWTVGAHAVVRAVAARARTQPRT
jgi:hypothetical protein